MKAYGAVDVYIHILLISAPAEDEWPASRSDRFTSGNHWIGGWLEPKGLCERHGEEIILDPTGTRTPTPRLCNP
jgi:hypothetical protein